MARRYHGNEKLGEERFFLLLFFEQSLPNLCWLDCYGVFSAKLLVPRPLLKKRKFRSLNRGKWYTGTFKLVPFSDDMQGHPCWTNRYGSSEDKTHIRTRTRWPSGQNNYLDNTYHQTQGKRRKAKKSIEGKQRFCCYVRCWYQFLRSSWDPSFFFPIVQIYHRQPQLLCPRLLFRPMTELWTPQNPSTGMRIPIHRSMRSNSC